ncbi:MAG: 50S ribosomal protein L35 [Verrucomicrobiota bacterium]
MSSKTRKAVAKRFKITAKGKVIGSASGRRHLAATKNRKRKRRLAKAKIMSEADYVHIKDNLPFA